MMSPSDDEGFHEYSELGESRSEKPKNLEDRLKEKDNEIRDKYGMNLTRFVIENCKDGAVTVFMCIRRSKSDPPRRSDFDPLDN